MGEESISVNPFDAIYKKCNSAIKPTEFPSLIDIELTNYCNLNCPYCPTGNGSAKRPKGYMTGNVWNIILKELAEHKTPIRFVRWGEPTLHPKLYDWIREAKDKGLLVHINTNGVNLDIDRVRKSGLDSIKVSLHGQRGIILPNRIGGLYFTAKVYRENFNTKDLTKPPEKYKSCSEVIAKLSINWDGTVSACCADYDNKMLVGDIKSKSLAEIWNGHKLNYYRKMLKDMRHAELELCRCCSNGL